MGHAVIPVTLLLMPEYRVPDLDESTVEICRAAALERWEGELAAGDRGPAWANRRFADRSPCRIPLRTRPLTRGNAPGSHSWLPRGRLVQWVTAVLPGPPVFPGPPWRW